MSRTRISINKGQRFRGKFYAKTHITTQKVKIIYLLRSQRSLPENESLKRYPFYSLLPFEATIEKIVNFQSLLFLACLR